MKYEDWHKKYIEGNPKTLLEEKKWKNRHGDKEQYERYYKVLGNDISVKSLDDFQNLKSNDDKIYGLINLDYSRRYKLINHPELKLPNLEKAFIAVDKFAKYLFAGKNEQGLIKVRLITSKDDYDINN